LGDGKGQKKRARRSRRKRWKSYSRGERWWGRNEGNSAGTPILKFRRKARRKLVTKRIKGHGRKSGAGDQEAVIE